MKMWEARSDGQMQTWFVQLVYTHPAKSSLRCRTKLWPCSNSGRCLAVSHFLLLVSHLTTMRGFAITAIATGKLKPPRIQGCRAEPYICKLLLRKLKETMQHSRAYLGKVRCHGLACGRSPHSGLGLFRWRSGLETGDPPPHLAEAKLALTW